ncbi:phosphatidylethanolamine-binding protein [Sphaerosporella brunnea]|uniref:Phosphatidylethanolamine-binding protein n=1 Tax=Sphaerosporella brunnea TaxID=1250544 RepID=A0A5J5EQW7_9PEZI|nr:phosphatidylethanolamine-binding protein [Sphaerosporella brunnea]
MNYVPSFVEYGLGRLFRNFRGRDDKLIQRGSAFANCPEPSLTLECPEVGPSGSSLSVKHTAFGEQLFPTLRWPAVTPNIKEYLLIVEDPDAPLPNPITHGLFYSIPATATGVTAQDIELVKGSAVPNLLKGGFKYSPNRGHIYRGPRPPRGHGPHRYWFTLIGMNEALDVKKLSPLAKKEELLVAIQGKVVGWGSWIGVFENE